jgi:hypothetical protein
MANATFQCPHCQQEFQVPLALLGEEIGCPRCNGPIALPRREEQRQAEGAADLRDCPFCGESILAVAIKCKHCSEFLDERPDIKSASEPQSVQQTTGRPKCQQCSGEMKKKTVSSGNCAGLVLALIVFCVGVAITIAFLPFGLIVGPLVCLFALFMGGKRSKVWKCVKCGSIVNRA